jgi:hypothetical protein
VNSLVLLLCLPQWTSYWCHEPCRKKWAVWPLDVQTRNPATVHALISLFVVSCTSFRCFSNFAC